MHDPDFRPGEESNESSETDVEDQYNISESALKKRTFRPNANKKECQDKDSKTDSEVS